MSLWCRRWVACSFATLLLTTSSSHSIGDDTVLSGRSLVPTISDVNVLNPEVYPPTLSIEATATAPSPGWDRPLLTPLPIFISPDGTTLEILFTARAPAGPTTGQVAPLKATLDVHDYLTEYPNIERVRIHGLGAGVKTQNVPRAAPYRYSEIGAESMEKTQGSTRSKGSYRVYEDDGRVKVEAKFSVRKSGVSGTGKGVMALIITDPEGDKIYSWSKGFTVGADAVDGVAEKEESVSITLFGTIAQKILNEGGAIVFTAQTSQDSIGIPTSANEWIEVVGDITRIIAGLDVGGSANQNGWRITRILR